MVVLCPAKVGASWKAVLNVAGGTSPWVVRRPYRPLCVHLPSLHTTVCGRKAFAAFLTSNSLLAGRCAAYAERMEDVDALWFQRHRVDVVLCDAEFVLADEFRQTPALDLLHDAMAKDSVSGPTCPGYGCSHEARREEEVSYIQIYIYRTSPSV